MVLKINGNIMPSPSKLHVVLSDIRAEERNAAGDTVVDRVGTKRRLECEWAYIKREDLAWLLDHTKDIFFSVEYFDPYENALKTIECSVGERAVRALIYRDHIPEWGALTMTLTER